MGINCDGIGSKLTSVIEVIDTLKPHIVNIQETKSKKPGKLKLDGYHIFEKVRKNGQDGGGILTAVATDLSPELATEHGEDEEILSVNIKIDKLKIKVINIYAPQVSETFEKRNKFWSEVDGECRKAREANIEIIIQGDTNAWVGSDVIPGDTNKRNSSGEILNEFLKRNPDITVLNGLSNCEGVITRRRQKLDKIEESSIDMIMTSENLTANLIHMKIDEEKEHAVTNFTKKHNKKKITSTDHNVITAEFGICVKKKVSQRIEIFNFNDPESIEKFKEATAEETIGFNEALEEKGEKSEKQMENWMKTLMSTCKKNIKKIRIQNRRLKPPKEAVIIRKRRNLKKILNKKRKNINFNNEEEKEAMEEIEKIEEEIGVAIRNRNINEIKKIHKQYDEEGSNRIKVSAMWKKFKQSGAAKKASGPTAVRNWRGHIVDNKADKCKAAVKEMKERLRPRPTIPSYKFINQLDKELFSLKIEKAKTKKQKEFTPSDLLKVLKKLKTKKARDFSGLNNVIFKPNNSSRQFRRAILNLINKITRDKTVPRFIRRAIISLIPKLGSRMKFSNYRGIFLLSVLRGILMKMIFMRNRDVVEENMTEFNVGAQRNKAARDNIFVINSIINENLQDMKANKQTKNLVLQIYDYKQMFDALNSRKAIGDLFDKGVKNDDLLVIYEANKDIVAQVKIDEGVSEEFFLEENILQGDTWGPAIATVQMDTIPSQWEDDDTNVKNMYRDEVSVNILGMVDDLIGISNEGIETIKLNAYINSKSAEKNLQFGITKCKKMVIGKKNKSDLISEVKIDQWEQSYDNSGNLLEEYKGKIAIENVDKHKYLGIWLESNGSNNETFKERRNKLLPEITVIHDKLKDMKLGKFHVQTALQLRESILMGKLLYGTEVMFNIGNDNMKVINQIDTIFLRKLLDTPCSTPIINIYQDLGILTPNHLIIRKRIMYLQHILNSKETSLIKMTFLVQNKKTKKGDWAETVQKDLADIDLDLDHITNMSKNQLKRILNMKLVKKQLSEMKVKTENRTKMKHLKFEELKLAEYLSPDSKIIKFSQQQLMFKIRNQTIDLKVNYKHGLKNLNCRMGCNNLENLNHLVNECPKLSAEDEVHIDIDINDKESKELKQLVDIIEKKLIKREELEKLNNKENNERVLNKKRKKVDIETEDDNKVCKKKRLDTNDEKEKRIKKTPASNLIVIGPLSDLD